MSTVLLFVGTSRSGEDRSNLHITAFRSEYLGAVGSKYHKSISWFKDIFVFCLHKRIYTLLKQMPHLFFFISPYARKHREHWWVSHWPWVSLSNFLTCSLYRNSSEMSCRLAYIAYVLKKKKNETHLRCHTGASTTN